MKILIGRVALLAPILLLLCSPSGQSAPEQIPDTVNRPTKVNAKPKELHRLDFRIEGKSCPVCLHAIENKIKSINGVIDAAVMLRHPFGASIIYQPEDATVDYILSMIKVKEPGMTIVAVKDTSIDKIPKQLDPSQDTASNNATSQQ